MGVNKNGFIKTLSLQVLKSSVFCKRRVGTSVIMTFSAVPIFSLGGELIQRAQCETRDEAGNPRILEFMGTAAPGEMCECSLASKHPCSSDLPPLEVRHLELAKNLNVNKQKAK